jgi:hypothetical protein
MNGFSLDFDDYNSSKHRNLCWIHSYTLVVYEYLAVLYRMSQEEKSVFWEVMVSDIMSNKVYMYMYPIPNGFRDRAISLYSALYTVHCTDEQHAMSSHHMQSALILTVEFFKKCITLGKLYQLRHLNNKCRY